MSLTTEQKRRLAVALTSVDVAEAIVAAIDSQGSGPAAVVAPFGATTNIPAAACAGGAAPTAAQVNTAIDTVSTAVESRLDALESKLNAILVALKNASLMATA